MIGLWPISLRWRSVTSTGRYKYCTSLVRLAVAVERAQTRFGGLTSVLESPAAADPRWLARTKKDLGTDGTFINTMAAWMAEWDTRLAGVAVDAGRAYLLDGRLWSLRAAVVLRLRMRRTCHETDAGWASQVTIMDRVTINLTGVADVSVRRILHMVLGARTGGQLGEARRMGPRVGLRTVCWRRFLCW